MNPTPASTLPGTDAAHAAVGSVDLGARAGHGDPHRRMRLLQRMQNDGHVAEAEEFAFVIEDIIDPAETRAALVEFATLAAPLRQAGVRTVTYRP